MTSINADVTASHAVNRRELRRASQAPATVEAPTRSTAVQVRSDTGGIVVGNPGGNPGGNIVATARVQSAEDMSQPLLEYAAATPWRSS
ncbi:hypothetical protein GCM10023193_55570 [Planotetraspora kaengkrachanensis]|uniref:Uncharacterized protein n=1 Tax=Planotetraspora kaengkrachanensis TaxID=575193 RepID=A0A8J3PUK2_9ACTN|nr:hypothetical protein Pka01_44420 [Planotetraspora kaengkrachanensis]